MSVFTLSENHISGVLAIPTVSRNGNFYLPQELKRQHGKRIPVYLDHEDLETRYNEDGTRIPTGRLNPLPRRGEVVLNWNEMMNQLEYAGELWDKEAIRRAREENYDKVSLAGDPQSVEPFHGVRAPLGLNMFSMAMVRHDNPGIPQTTFNMAAESITPGPVVAESVVEMAARRFILLEGNLQMSAPQQLSNAPPFSRPPVSGIEPLLARQNGQTMQTGVGIPAGTGVGPQPGINIDPHLGGTGAVGVTGTSNITPMAGMPHPTAYPTPNSMQPQSGPMLCPHALPMSECPQCGQGMTKEGDDKKDHSLLPDLLGYYLVTKLVHGPSSGGMTGMEAAGSSAGGGVATSTPGASMGAAPAGDDDSLRQHFEGCPTCNSIYGKLFGGKKAQSDAEAYRERLLGEIEHEIALREVRTALSMTT